MYRLFVRQFVSAASLSNGATALALFALVVLNLAVPHAMQAADHPNILLILTDDQGFGDLSIHGNPHLSTPNLDALGKESIRFDRFYVNSFCAPTRAALLTGRYPLRCGVWGVTHNKETMLTEEVTLAEALQPAGYTSACIGKWHNGEQFPYTPHGQGFDEFFGFTNGHFNNYFDPVLLRGSRPENTNGYITDILTDDAIRFIEEHREGPFFCYLAYNAPHSPFQVPDKFYERFADKGFNEQQAAFYGMCENIDENVGRLLTRVDELGLRENTIVLYLTDNGGTVTVPIYNAGMRGGKTSTHEGGSRVPLFVRYPARFQEPKVIEQISSHIDLYPTLLELAGVEQPEGPPLDGVSLVPLLEGDTENWPERTLFTHNPIDETNRYPGAVRTQQYRLVRRSANPNRPWQLFDMQADPGEDHDLARERPELVKELSLKYEEWMDDISQTVLKRLSIPVGYQEENPVVLNAPQSFPSGSLQFHQDPGWAQSFLVNWTDPESKVEYDIDVVQPGRYRVEVLYGCPPENAGAKLEFRAGSAQCSTTVPAHRAEKVRLAHRDEDGHDKYVDREWGSMELGDVQLNSGVQRIQLQAQPIPGKEALDFKSLILTWIEPPPAD